MFREIKDINFREVDRQFCITEGISEHTKELLIKSGIVVPKEDDAMLLFGYIDIEAGITFEFICTCHHDENGSLVYTERDMSIGLKLRYGAFEEKIDILEREGQLEPFEYIATAIEESYYGNRPYWKTRFLEAIDRFRAEGFPDDIQVLFAKKGLMPELVWGRCRGVDSHGRTFVELLNEPYDDYGVHAGDMVYIKFLLDANEDLAFLGANLEAGVIRKKKK